MPRRINLIFILMTIIILIFLNISKNNTFNEKDIIGTWAGGLNSTQIKLHINDNYSCKLIIIDHEKSIDLNSNGYCEFNFQKKPGVLYIKKIDKIGSLYASFQFVNKNSLFISKFSNQEKLNNILINKENSFKLKKLNGFHLQ
jgi:hypothetical protein